MKKALITGVKGQDGAYLAKLLLEKWYEVHGADIGWSHKITWIEILWIQDQITMHYMNLLDVNNVNAIIQKIMPDELYNFAAQSSIWVSFDKPIVTSDIDAMWVVRILEALRQYCPECRFFQASSSELFGNATETPQTESTPFNPRNPYGVAKGYAHWITKNFRESYNMHVSSWILYNHESPIRWTNFVTRKITHAVAKISKGKQDVLVLWNINAERDRWYAPEYVQAMRLMLQQDTADDYILATGKLHSVRDFVEKSFAHVWISLEWSWSWVDEKWVDTKTWKTLVTISEEFYRPLDDSLLPLVWNTSKAKEILGREAWTDLDMLTKKMVEFDLSLL